jgi:uncharacterized protein YuzE
MSAALRMRYDPEVDALYVTVREGEVAETVEVEEAVYVDVDDDGRPLGVEFLSGAGLLPFLVRRGGEFVVPARLDTAADADALRDG